VEGAREVERETQAHAINVIAKCDETGEREGSTNVLECVKHFCDVMNADLC
jgi:hypothetical protein